MKNVFVTKDAYIDNTVRVNYWEKDHVFKIKEFEFNKESNKPEQKEIEKIDDYLLFCERLNWIEEESELDNQIESNRLTWENKINIV
jgi:hypothetical protein